ncbi:MAG: beta-galactosidase [Ruminococcus sp.]
MNFIQRQILLPFVIFVKEKYKTLDNLNEAWGTVFWNQTYTDWEQIYVPRPVLNNGCNPHLRAGLLPLYFRKYNFFL